MAFHHLGSILFKDWRLREIKKPIQTAFAGNNTSNTRFKLVIVLILLHGMRKINGLYSLLVLVRHACPCASQLPRILRCVIWWAECRKLALSLDIWWLLRGQALLLLCFSFFTKLSMLKEWQNNGSSEWAYSDLIFTSRTGLVYSKSLIGYHPFPFLWGKVSLL